MEIREKLTFDIAWLCQGLGPAPGCDGRTDGRAKERGGASDNWPGRLSQRPRCRSGDFNAP